MRGRTGRPLSLLQARCAMLGRALPPTSALAPGPLHRRRPPSCWAAPVDHCRFRRPAAPCRTGPSPTTSTPPSSCCTVGTRPRAGLCMPTAVAFAGSLRHAGQGSTDYHALVSLPCRHPAGSARHRWQATATPGQWRGEAVASRQGGCMGMFHVSPCPCGTLMGWPSRAGSAGRPISAPLHLQAAPRPGGTCPRPAARTHLPQGPTACGPPPSATRPYGPRGVNTLRPVWRHPHRAGAHDAGDSTPARGPPLSATGSYRSPGPSPHRAGVSASPYGGPGPDCAAGGPAPMGTDHGAT